MEEKVFKGVSFDELAGDTSFVIPEGFQIIGKDAFRGCSSLINITIPDGITTIYECAFYGCTSLKSINIPKSVTTIGAGAFANCKSLTNINIPKRVADIGPFAFENCINLTDVTIQTIFLHIDEFAFVGCSNLSNIEINSFNYSHHIVDDCLIEIKSQKVLKGLKNCDRIPADGSVEEIGPFAFRGCKNLYSINIPDCIELIGFGAFMFLIISDKLLKMKIQTRPQEISPCPDCSAKPHKLKAFCESCGRFLGRKNWAFSKKTYATMLLLLLACLVVVQTIQAPTFVTAKGEIEYSSSDVNHEPVNLFPPMSGYQLSYLYRDTAYEKTSGQDLSAMYYYGAKNDTKFSIYADIGVSSSISLLHNWEACLISVQTAKGQDSLVKTLDQREVELLSGSNLVAQFLAFDNTDGTRQVTLYWYEKAAIKTGVSVEQKYVRISLIVLTNQTTSIEEPEKDLFAAGQVIAAKWEPLKSQALISLGVPAQQALLAALSIFFVSAFAVQYFAEQRKISVDTKIFSSYGSAKERIVLAAVKDLSKKNKDLTGAEITEAVQKARGKKVNAKVVQAVLLRLEQNGFVKRKLVSIGNSPKIVWTYRSTE
jgi:hypothetical protein